MIMSALPCCDSTYSWEAMLYTYARWDRTYMYVCVVPDEKHASINFFYICASMCVHKLAAVVVLLGTNWVSDYGPISTNCYYMYAHVHMHSSLHVHTRLAGIVLIKARLTTITLYVCDMRIRLLLMFNPFAGNVAILHHTWLHWMGEVAILHHQQKSSIVDSLER